MRKLESKKISKLLNKKGFFSSPVADKIKKLQEINKILQNHLPVSLLGHCRVANVRDHTLVLSVDSPGWKSSLRFHAPGLLRELGHTYPAGFTAIEIMVDPGQQEKTVNQRRTAKLSRESARLLHSMAESTDDPQLKEALLRLSGRKSAKTPQ